MVILRLETEEIACDVAYALQGRQFGKCVILRHNDPLAIELATSLAGSQVRTQLSVGGFIFGLIIVFELITYGFAFSFALRHLTSLDTSQKLSSSNTQQVIVRGRSL